MELHLMPLDRALASEDFCYLTTTGRVSGKQREIEIWFGLENDTLYILSGGGNKSDWVKNLRKAAAVAVRIGERRFEGRARIVSDKKEDALARQLLLDKYTSRYSGGLSDWGRNALPVAVELRVEN
jgi:deazaflavin-dependent oxidoreductase (nitroreductase family)